jgi:hypothetical protein
LAVALWWLRSDELGLGRSAISSGWMLAASVLALASYHFRKKLPSLPLGSSAAWLQWHAYLALVSGGIFLWHVGLRVPDGWLEASLAVTFALTFAIGVVGLYLSRTIPAQLARTGSEFRYESIPLLRRLNAEAAGQLVLQTVANSGQSTLADLFMNRLYDYLACSRSLVYHLAPSSRVRRELMRELSEADRYLSHNERQASEKLFRHIRRKDDLDFHQARQGLLKWWLVAHLTLTGLLVVLGSCHAVVVLAFRENL